MHPRRAEYQASVQPENGVLYPGGTSLIIGRLMGPRLYPEFIHKLMRLGSSGLMQVPSSMADLDAFAARILARLLIAALIFPAREKIALARCAWDICGSEFGSAAFRSTNCSMAATRTRTSTTIHGIVQRKQEHLERSDRFFRTWSKRRSRCCDQDPNWPTRLPLPRTEKFNRTSISCQPFHPHFAASRWRLYQTSFRQGFIDASGVETRYVQAGKPDVRQAVLMLHGTGGSWEAFWAHSDRTPSTLIVTPSTSSAMASPNRTSI